MAQQQQEKQEKQGAGGGLLDQLPTDELMAELKNLVQALGERAVGTLGDKMGSATERLTEYAAGNGAKPLLKAGVSGLGGKVKSAVTDKIPGLGGGGGGNGKQAGQHRKVTNIVESIDIGAPVQVVYDQWTRFEDYPDFTKKVESVDQEADEEVKWQAKIVWSRRSWTSHIVDQVPEQRIVWESEGEKGHVDGAVTFHELTPDLTRVLLVLEYHPQGFFEKLGNLWRAQGRRARLELKHFRRHVMTDTILHPDDVKGWRGEIRDGEVVDGADDQEQDQQDKDQQDKDQQDKAERDDDERDDDQREEEGEDE